MKATERGTQKHRQLPEGGCSQRVSAEKKEYARACAPPRMAETDITSASGLRTRLLEPILDPDDLYRAAKHVIRNKAAGGIDGIQVHELSAYLESHQEEIVKQIREITWKRWKRIRTRFANLKRLGIKADQAWQWANTRKSYWRTANSPILRNTLTKETFPCTGVH